MSRAGVRTLENLTYGDKGVAVSTDETGRGSASYKSSNFLNSVLLACICYVMLTDL